MQVIESAAALRKELDDRRGAGRTVGLVPTMGYLHRGHVSLVERAGRECDVVVASIFVNPLQFAPTEDLSSYPRDLEHDVALASDAGVDLLFVPDVEEMYPDGPPAATVHVTGVSDILEGASRPGHFDGVATVVAKLFNLAGACRAYFGEKDFQQLVVVRRLARDLSFPVEVVGCPTVREPDGLALSSRNVYLDQEQRRAATVLYRALNAGRRSIERGERDPSAVRRAMADVAATESLARLDYLAAVDATTLHEPESLVGEVRLLAAARLGHARLIDNLGVKVTCDAE